MLVGADRVVGGDGSYDIVNPATETVVGQAPEVSVEQVEAATAAAAEAFPAWSRTTPTERSELLTRLADILAREADDLVPLVQAETGAVHAGRQDHAGAADDRPLPPLRPRRRTSSCRSRCRPPRCRPRRWRPAGCSARSSSAARWASSPPSRRTTSRWSTWPARSAPPWRWATPSWSSRPRRTRWPSSASPTPSSRPASRRASSTSSPAAGPRPARPSSPRRTSTWSASPARPSSGSASARSPAAT